MPAFRLVLLGYIKHYWTAFFCPLLLEKNNHFPLPLFCWTLFYSYLKKYHKKIFLGRSPVKKITSRILLSSFIIGIILFILYFSSQYFTGVLPLSEIKIGTKTRVIST